MLICELVALLLVRSWPHFVLLFHCVPQGPPLVQLCASRGPLTPYKLEISCIKFSCSVVQLFYYSYCSVVQLFAHDITVVKLLTRVELNAALLERISHC